MRHPSSPPRRRPSGLRRPRISGLAAAQTLTLLTLATLATGLPPLTPAAWAIPEAPVEFCRTYPDAPACAGAPAPCGTCHTTPPNRNSYGAAVAAKLAPGVERPLSKEVFLLRLPEALHAVDEADSDQDGVSNVEELAAGSLPHDPDSRPTYPVCDAVQERAVKRFGDTDQVWGYNVCGYDAVYAFKKATLDFCGRSATRAEIASYAASDNREAALAALLDSCFDSEWWQGPDGVLWNLANTRIEPIASVKSGDDAGPIPLADYLDDYNLFVWTQIDGHDARDLLTADYFVERGDGTKKTAGSLKLTVVKRNPIEDYQKRGFGKAQLVDFSYRAGMITARWFLMQYVMFTAVPRTAAAQAYRAYLGLDIARMEGLHSVAGEPLDWDAKDVKRPECASCHATLDPLTYPFSRYEGIGGGVGGSVGFGPGKYLPYSYNPSRLERFVKTDGPKVTETPEEGVLLGQKVKDLVAWGKVAANSDAFARKLVLDYWQLLIGEPPRPSEMGEFNQLWQDFKTTHKYSVEAMLKALVRTEAYGVP